MSAFRDLVNHVKVVSLINPIVVNNDTEGKGAAGVDLKQFDSVLFIASLGESGDTLAGSPALKIDVKLQHSDTDVDGDYVAVTSANDVLLPDGGNAAAPDANGIIYTADSATTDDAKQVVVGYVGKKRYARVILDMTGTHTNGTPATVLAVLGHPHLSPISYS